MTIRVDKHNRGYVPMHQTHYPGNKPDLKESFNVGMALTPDDPEVKSEKPLHGVNRWPELEGFRAPVEAYFDAVTALGHRLLGPLAICLGMSAAELRGLYSRPIAFMRLFHYPPDSNVDEKEFGAAEHKDYGFLTILAQDRQRRARSALAGRRDHSGAAAHRRVRDQCRRHAVGDHRRALQVAAAPGHQQGERGALFDSVLLRSGFRRAVPTMPEVSAGEYLLRKFNKFYKHRQGACRDVSRARVVRSIASAIRPPVPVSSAADRGCWPARLTGSFRAAPRIATSAIAPRGCRREASPTCRTPRCGRRRRSPLRVDA